MWSGSNKLVLLVTLVSSLGTQGQNLVLNGSFEEYTDCPPSFGYWANVVGWISPFTASADYFNVCAQNLGCSIPLNDFGYQHAADGVAYMGLCTYVNMGMYREVIATELIEPLQPGVPVYCSYKVSPGGFGSNAGNSATWSAKGPDLNFFTQLPETSQPWLFSGWAAYLFPNSAAIEMQETLNDTSTWITIRGVYIPDSAYTWMAIMNFYENDLSMQEIIDTIAWSDKAYAYIDDICVSYDPTYCDVSLEMRDQPSLSVWMTPNPFHDVLSLHVGNGSTYPTLVNLLDMQGRTCWSGIWPNGMETMRVDIPEFPPSVYIVAVDYRDGTRTSTRVVKYSP